MLRSKHPTEDPVAMAKGKAQAEQRAGITAIVEQEQQPNVTSELLDAQDQIPEMQNLFEEATARSAIKNPTYKARQVRLDYATAIWRPRCEMNWSRSLRRLRRLPFPAVFCPKYSGYCTRALTFPRWGNRQDQWRAVMSCRELLVLFSATNTAGNWQTTSSPGASTA